MSDSVTLTGLEAAYALAAIQLRLEHGGLDPRDIAAYDTLKRKLASIMRLDPDVAKRLDLVPAQPYGHPKGYYVHGLDSPSAQEMLALRGLTRHDLATALAEFQKREAVVIGTEIGLTDDGFFGSSREGWHPDQPDAFAEPLIAIPWTQLLEYLGRVPPGTTGKLFKLRGTRQ
jgi:hypothetical protein